ncbi:MAG TPA: EAL domain-containing protein [Rhodanobacteraceae bacterium]|nr:EAL domain-containing protein [Rhodanobacteraceae bacterium]
MGWMIRGLVAVLLALAVVPTGAPDAAPPARIRVAGDGNYPPYMFIDAGGQLQGYEVDMWRLFEEHTGIKVDLMPMDWASAQRAVQTGKVDVIDLIYRTPSRESLYDFSASYATLPIGIFVDRRIRGIHDLDSLRGFPIGVKKGDACAEKLAAQGFTDLHEYSRYQQVVEDAVRGNLRMFCMDEGPANYFLYRDAALDRFYKAFVLYTGELHRAVRKGNAPVLQAVERGMARITPAERAKLHARWLEHPVVLVPYLKAARIGAGVIVALIALMTLWVWMLRRSVARRTRELGAEQGNLRALFDASPDAMWVTDRHGVLLKCNDRANHVFGMPSEKMIGYTAAQAMDAANTIFTSESRTMNLAVLNSRQRQRAVLPLALPGGNTLDLDIIKVPLYASDGEVRGILNTARDISERLQTEERLRLWAHAFQHATFAVAMFDARSKCITAANPAFARERGYTPEEMVGMPVDALYPEDLLDERQRVRHDINKLDHAMTETEQVTRDGRRFPVLLDISITHDANGEAQYVIVYAQDISDRKRTESELRLAAVAFQSQASLVVMDPNRVIQRVNGAFASLTGYEPDQAIGQPFSLLRSRHHDEPFHQHMWEQVRRDGIWQGEQWIQVRQGQPKVVRAVVSAVADAAGNATHYICSMIDLTSEREAHASVDHMTFFDSLTDLPNRHFLHGRLQHLLEDGDSRGGALLMFDLDHFKRVNDLRGHAAGDALLALIAQRLRHLQDDRFMLSRFSGGTFALLADCGADQPSATPKQAWVWAERLRQALREPFQLGGDTPVTISISIGWTELVPGHGTPESVLKEAELAMYRAKAAGRDQVCRFEPAMHAELVHHEELVQDLRRAIIDETFDLHLQAQVDRAGQVIGAEALLRWMRPSGERVPPDVFIPIAEDNGLIFPLGDWVLRRACAYLVAWSAQASLRDLSLAVNVSARQFAQAGFVDSVRGALSTTGAVASRLKLEITETAVLEDFHETAAKLAELRAIGVKVSLDDFGTGYSSLAYLTRLPLDQLKIDRSFVDRLTEDRNDAMVAQTIIGMGRGLGLDVIAEGVETEAQRNFLMAQGCDAFQGYLIARPVPREAFEALLDEQVYARQITGGPRQPGSPRAGQRQRSVG